MRTTTAIKSLEWSCVKIKCITHREFLFDMNTCGKLMLVHDVPQGRVMFLLAMVNGVAGFWEKLSFMNAMAQENRI